jgi:hypothetical protein
MTGKAAPDVSAVPVLVKRRLQAEVLGPLHAEMVRELGAARADELLDRAVREAAIAEGRRLAEGAPEGRPSMAHFIRLFELWKQGGALEIEELAADGERFDFNVTRCRYAEMYREMGLGGIGHLLSCNRDGAFVEGYDPDITLEREKTIMQGHSCCTFRYRRRTGP